MKRVDSKSAKDATPVEISFRIIDALIDAVKSERAEITLSFVKDPEPRDTWCRESRTAIRISYGGTDTFICTNLEREFLAIAEYLAEREEEAANKFRDAQRAIDASQAAARSAKDSRASSTEPPQTYTPNTPAEESK